MFSGIDMQVFSSAQQDDGLSFIKAYTTIQFFSKYENSTQCSSTYPILTSTGFYWIFPWKIRYCCNNYWLKSLLITFILCQ